MTPNRLLLSAACALFLFLAPATAASSSGAVLDDALDTISVEEISADLHFLASDEMKGRNTPSPEQRIAARFIAARLQRLGWKPGAKDGYIFEYEMAMKAVDGAASKLSGKNGNGSVELELGRDYAFSPSGLADYEISGEGAVFAGTGSKDDIEKLELDEHWAVCTSSDLSSRVVLGNLRKAGVVGVLVLPGPGLEAPAMKTRVEEWGTQAREGRLGRVSRRHRVPYLYVTQGGADKLLALAGKEQPKLGDVLDLDLTEMRKVDDSIRVPLENVAGYWPGTDPKLKHELLIVSAHYDHIGVSTETGEVFNGADDNGSGTTGLLAIAEGIARYGPMRRSVMLMWVSGEEKGLLGSAAWTKDPYLPDEVRPVANINIDMIGRNASDSLLITPTEEHDEHNGLVRLAESLSPLEGFPELGDCDAYWSRSDHANFARNLDIPVTFLFSDVHEDYHKVTDTVDKIDMDKIRRVARLVVRMLDGLQSDELAL